MAAGPVRDYRIQLVNATLGPAFPIADEQARKLAAAISASGERTADEQRVHLLVQLEEIPTGVERAAFQGEGIVLLDYISNYAWIMAVPRGLVTSLPQRKGVRYVKAWAPDEKLHHSLAAGEVGPWARDEASGRVHLFVYLHRDAPLEEGRRLIEAADGIAVQAHEGAWAWSAWVDPDALPKIAADEQIYWLEEYPPPLDEMNDGARVALNVNAVGGGTSYNLTGSGVNVFVFDGGRARPTHEQLVGHITSIDAAATSDHPTHVATTVAGNGTGMARATGMAPQAWILTGAFSPGAGVLFYDSYGDMITDYSAARNNATHPADMATNSIGANVASNGYPCSYEGNYGASSRMIDRIVRGDELTIAGTNKRYIVTWAAGNERTGGTTVAGQCGGGFWTLPPPASAKNPITVAAINSDGHSMTEFSSWGPTDNGRLKPIIAGPGCELLTADGIYSALNTSNTAYGSMCGTSMATPAVAGVVALILERYHQLRGDASEPWNSAVKALLMHTARDLGPEGPDFMAGYGRVDAQAAVDLLNASELGQPQAYFHDVTVNTPSGVSQNDVHTWGIDVPAGSRRVKVSLAWDDYFSSVASGGPLVNDLDLELVAPDRTVHYPFVLDAAQPWLTATRGVNTVDNQEQVVVDFPAAGTWTVRVRGETVPQGPQSFGLVYSYEADPGLGCANEIDYSPATRNGGFEDGTQWVLETTSATIISGGGTRPTAHGGSQMLELLAGRNSQTAAYQTVTLPADVGEATLSYWWAVRTTDTSSGNDWFTVDIRNTAGTLLGVPEFQHNGVVRRYNGTAVVTDPPRWSNVVIDLTPWKGQTVRIRFRSANSDDTALSTYWIDDVRVRFCTPPPRPVITSLVDADPCALSGVRVYFTGDAAATGYALLRDSVVVDASYSSGDLYSPGDGLAHSYVVRAYHVSGETNSLPEIGVDDSDCQCSTPPFFGGLTTVAQVPAGSTCGLRLSWTQGTSNCPSGQSLVYTVHRSTSSTFVPDASNVVARCLTGTSYDDTTTVSGTAYYYIVRAEDSTTWGSGLCNLGNQDGNLVRVSGSVAPVVQLADQVTTPLVANNGSATSDLSPATTIITATAATLNYSLAGTNNTANASVELLSPNNTVTLIKAYGSADPAKPVDVLAAYSSANGGPGTWKIRVSSNASRNMTLTLGTMQVNGTTCSSGAGSPDPVQFLTARSTSATNVLEWQNPAGGTYGSAVVRYRTDGTFPTSATNGTAVTCSGQDTALSRYNSCTHSGLANGTTYSYSIFVNNGSGVHSSRRTVAATPFDTTGARKWSFSTGAANLAPAGIRPGALGTGAVYEVSNDRVLHAMNTTAAGGTWPRTAPNYSWLPLSMNAPAQHRPGIAPLAAGSRAFLASQDGYAYAVDAATGAQVWMSPKLGDVLQANPAGLFSDFKAGAPNLVFVGTRNATSANKLYALDPATGAVVGTPFDNGGGSSAIGIITGITVDYATNYVYFTSRAAGVGSSHTLWCLNATGGTLAKVWSLAVGDVDGSPVLYEGRIYVGTNTGQVRAVDATTHLVVWTYPAAPGSDGPVKGYVTPDYGTTPLRLYYSTNETVWGLTLKLDGSGVDSFWSNAVPSNPSTPLLLFGTAHLLVGCGDGTLQQLNTATGAVVKSVSVGTAALGSPAMDSVNGLAHVGSTAGVLHTVTAPIP